jgi:catechol 2,3-dioxygenase-like lactoylglutathione lyase family enzyme
MTIKLNHTIVWSKNKKASARFFTEMFGRPEATTFSHFLVVEMDNGVSLDFAETRRQIVSQHYAFLVSESEFDAIHSRIKERRLEYWADPGQTRLGTINHHDGGRGLYFEDPSGHLLEIITRPYGSGA